MPTTPYARLLLSIDGGDATAGGSICAAEAEVQPVYESTTGWPASPVPYLEVYEYPDGWTLSPSDGWATTTITQPSGATASVWRYYGTTPPPAFAAPALATFGKVKLRLVVGGGRKAGKVSADMTSEAAVLVRSSLGLESVAYLEGTEFGDFRAWVAAIQKDMRTIEDAFGSGAGLGSYRFLIDAASAPAALPSALALRALVSTLPVLAAGAAPLSLTRRDGHDDSTNDEILSLVRKITADAAVNADDKGSLAFYFAAARAGRLRSQVVSTSPLTCKLVASTKTSDGEIDALTIGADGNITINVPSGVARTLLCEGQAGSLTVGAAQRSGTGANNGTPVTLAAGQGQNQDGGNNNNNGADLTLAAGAQGTGGGGAAGLPGALVLKSGTTEIDRINGGGAAIGAGVVTVTTIATIRPSGTSTTAGLVVHVYCRRDDNLTAYVAMFHVLISVVAGTLAVDGYEAAHELDLTGLGLGSGGSAVVDFTASGNNLLVTVGMGIGSPATTWKVRAEALDVPV